jgi:hypothetical protein
MGFCSSQRAPLRQWRACHPPNIGFRVYDEDELRALHQQAGFSRTDAERYSDTAVGPDGRRADRKGFFVISTA